MEIHEFRRHPLFSRREERRVFRHCWNFRLRQGENTRHRMQCRAEEIYLILDGTGRMTVGAQTSVVRPGEVILVPPRVDHHLENDSCPLLQGISVEAEHGLFEEVSERDGGSDSSGERVSPRRMDEILEELPREVDEGTAIRTIVGLFDICGMLSEQIDDALGLDNDLGRQTLGQLERKLMSAVGTIVDRYREGHGWDEDWLRQRLQ